MVVFSLFLGADAYYEYRAAECVYSSTDLSDAEFIDSYYFNKVRDIQFNSTVGKYVGFTEYGVKCAEKWNNDPQILQPERTELERVCKPNAQLDIDAILSKAVPPKVQVRSEQKPRDSQLSMLMCSAYDFYPPAISVSWLRNDEPVTSEVISTEELADGDWYYQIHSHLEYTPKSGEKISCVVEHASFQTPRVYDWDPSLPESERNKVAIGASGLVLGIVLSAAGFIYYKKKSTGRILVPS
ncbi:HLA class II histocompatibility antigen, DQ beta 1 chain-like [Electrophorus electricus]|uniref:HLA class II histocompatibility antigen, DQ beta 1 chain-like n=1 Tax=Electrophorus electricus TaxID=8005 RepID=UPI0015D0B7FB|nr:HLA class II histocompatibility antigen, DQ beta 1 chain-like [Electrophorus electricus]